MARKKCIVSGCNTNRRCKGYCVKHYGRWLRHGDPLYEAPPKGCSVEGCDNKHSGRGYCRPHYDVWYVRGDPLAPPTRNRYEIRECVIVGDECHIPLPNGEVAICDAEDKDLVEDFNWSHYGRKGYDYVATNRYIAETKKGSTLYLHRHIMAQYFEITGLEIDHIDHDGKNNLKSNLRAVTRRQNGMNRITLDRRNKSGYRGVHISKHSRKWRACVAVGLKHHVLGQYHDIEDAVHRRDLAVLELYGEQMLPQALNHPEKYDEYLKELEALQDRKSVV